MALFISTLLLNSGSAQSTCSTDKDCPPPDPDAANPEGFGCFDGVCAPANGRRRLWPLLGSGSLACVTDGDCPPADAENPEGFGCFDGTCIPANGRLWLGSAGPYNPIGGPCGPDPASGFIDGCQAGLVCSSLTGRGTCEKPVPHLGSFPGSPVGGPCGVNSATGHIDACQDGLVCSNLTGPGTCKIPVFPTHKPAQLGSSCGGACPPHCVGKEGDVCANPAIQCWYPPCGAGLTCTKTDEGISRCKKDSLGAGSALKTCYVDAQCPDGEKCIGIYSIHDQLQPGSCANVGQAPGSPRPGIYVDVIG